MHRYLAPVLYGLMISASHVLYDQAGWPSAKLPIVLHLLLGGVLFVLGRNKVLRVSYAALTLGLFGCALLLADEQWAMWPAGAAGIDQFEPALAWAPWIVVVGSTILACIALGFAARLRRLEQVNKARQAQFAAPIRLDVRPGSPRMLRPEDRRIISRQRARDDERGAL